MKKIFSALLTVCMLLGCLSACGSKNPSPSDDGSATTGAKDTIVFAQASESPRSISTWEKTPQRMM